FAPRQKYPKTRLRETLSIRVSLKNPFLNDQGGLRAPVGFPRGTRDVIPARCCGHFPVDSGKKWVYSSTVVKK
ncbi:MAG: hypothetical protein ACI4PC_07420, partial [Oscillospiraceae bacterium]